MLSWIIFIVSLIITLFIAAAWMIFQKKHVEKLATKNLTLALKCKYGIDIESDNPKTEDAITSALLDYFSPEHIENRVANLIGMITSILTWFLRIIFIIIFISIIGWSIYNNNPLTMMLWLYLLIETMTFAVLCFLTISLSLFLTNRFPGAPKKVIAAITG